MLPRGVAFTTNSRTDNKRPTAGSTTPTLKPFLDPEEENHPVFFMEPPLSFVQHPLKLTLPEQFIGGVAPVRNELRKRSGCSLVIGFGQILHGNRSLAFANDFERRVRGDS